MSAPSPYVWTFQPQRGTAAGASQDYSTRINWLSAGPELRGKVVQLNEARNAILMKEQESVPTPRAEANPSFWPAALIFQPRPQAIPVHPAHPDTFDAALTSNGAQLAGGAWINYKNGSVRYEAPLQLAEEQVGGPLNAFAIKHQLQLAGGALSASMSEMSGAPRIPRSGGIGSWQFSREFPPTVYLNPFSGSPDTFPHQFLSNYDSFSHTVDGYD
ncbi:pVIII [Murine mastadenovirus A]|uniref:Pre-hexon-linking protein VIII n=2 Tax=Murine adenovirus A serotype 1 TaxID=10530 RepID=CAP8_ADEM1|nr:pVIII protein [Murine mastadenovirus A]AP_000357.1 pVIII [Murine mastadenovirus A]P19722.1 RecName: Full=Pre-hexon-linking protein VIII; AltName: Full=Pre-protein VIII; Short=pVIII; Contains: RecName: Full=Hexon-linking protein-N; AltName: Full=12.1 kDa protein VIII; AltName: Full=Protein VIII-N; Contains: RecName: Full=Hexon-linking protein-C; AltName: Full=7.6 kDa protein VIII; AltName: Full=Protein VIII-C [Murine adenovirus 1]AAA42432.1 pVIII protein [Murine adenovirus 1]